MIYLQEQGMGQAGRDVKHRFDQRKWPRQPWTQGERNLQSLFWGVIVPVCLLGAQKDKSRVQLYHCSPTAKAGGLEWGMRLVL